MFKLRWISRIAFTFMAMAGRKKNRRQERGQERLDEKKGEIKVKEGKEKIQ